MKNQKDKTIFEALSSFADTVVVSREVLQNELEMGIENESK